ncbi:MAG TPA: phosphatase PAP2 family protein [Acidimicrobiia bacterium]|jgi:membrane-associated phospholipid phosphatase
MRERRTALFLVAAIALVLLVALYFFGVRTAWGQRIDAAALRGSGTLRPTAVHAAGRLLATIDVASLALIGAAIVLVAVTRRRPFLAIGVAIIIGASVVTTEMLKHVILPRPYLGVVDLLRFHPSFPSGHTTVAMSLAVAATLVTPVRARGWVALVAALYASSIGIATVATGNHRPSDPIGAVLVVTFWAALVMAGLTTISTTVPRERQGPTISPALALGGIIALGVAFAALVVTAVAIRQARLGSVGLRGAFVGAAAAIAGAAFVAIATLVWVLRDVTVDPPPPTDG